MSNAFKQLQSIWYEQLKRIGFNDIECPDGRLKHHINPKQTAAKTSFEETREYYLKASEFTEHFKFETKRDQRIWLHFSDGLSVRAIAKHMNLTKGFVEYRLIKMKEHFKSWLKEN